MSEALLISGATGFIGRSLVRRLLDDGHEVHVIVRSTPAEGVVDERAVVHMGCGSPDEVAAAVERAGAATCIHLASLYLASHEPADIPALVAANVTFGTMLLDALARAGGSRFVTTGTAWQHYGVDDGGYRSVNLYAATKTAFDHVVDWYADAHRMRAASILLPDTYGPGDPRRKVIALLMDAAASGTHLGMSPGEQLIDLVHVDDVVEAFRASLTALDSMEPGTRAEWGVTSGRPLSLRALADRCAAAVGSSVDVTFGERPYREREVMVPWVPAQAVPGWTARVGLEAGLDQLAHELHAARS